MNISNSKKQLAQIIHENGGWVNGAEFSAQDKDGEVFHYATKPSIDKGSEVWGYKGCIGEGEFIAKPLPNWHQTILSRDEYFHLYPAPDADVGSLSAALALVTDENKHEHVDSNPTIEQLAADYRIAKDHADRKQQEADVAKADAEAKLAELVAAGKALGLVLSVAGVEPELVITDWWDLRVGDRIWVGDSGRSRNCPEGEYEIAAIDSRYSDQPIGLAWPGGLTGVTWPQIHKRGWRFINRPAKGDTNA